MALSTPSGSLTSPSLPHSSDNLVEDPDQRLDAEQYLDKHVYVKDTFHNSTPLNIDRDANLIALLKGYASGTAIKVTWFHNMDSLANKQSNYSELSFMTNSVNYGYHRINDFEIRLANAMSFSFDQGTVVSEMTGEALIYPGFKAKTGDLFTYAIEPGVLGLFKVTSAPSRLSIRSRTSHTVQFKLVKILNSSDITEIQNRVREESWFDKQRFLTENAALLTRNDVINLDYINTHVKSMSKLFMSKFFDSSSYQSIVRPDGVYDPYIIGFVKKVIDTQPYFVEQLASEVPNRNVSFWEKLLDSKSVNWSIYAGYAHVDIYRVSVTTSRVTSLINRPYIELLSDGEEYTDVDAYISPNLRSIDVSDYTPLDTLLVLYLEYGVIDADILFTLIDQVYTAADMDQFYRVPIYVYFLRVLEKSIKQGNKIRLARPNQLPYFEIPFTADSENLDELELTVLSPSSKVVGIITDDGTPVYPEMIDIQYTSDGFIIDLTNILAELGVSAIEGTWKIVITNTSLLLS